MQASFWIPSGHSGLVAGFIPDTVRENLRQPQALFERPGLALVWIINGFRFAGAPRACHIRSRIVSFDGFASSEASTLAYSSSRFRTISLCQGRESVPACARPPPMSGCATAQRLTSEIGAHCGLVGFRAANPTGGEAVQAPAMGRGLCVRVNTTTLTDVAYLPYQSRPRPSVRGFLHRAHRHVPSPL